ncbi:hypothetical protein FISHEDRAFT_78686 [Fistulina hepatica ATCC 64428]|uniref:Uncharacterized protein n=1 Tax=Fistulina hepatica ATCC 64428 TaxID=1128425 RepID=A0A0D6ZZB2_9AGAR|nr:hypothetical protein FISHEDRAFT_78686 [Fistulina hepatica ATCC 64428]
MNMVLLSMVASPLGVTAQFNFNSIGITLPTRFTHRLEVASQSSRQYHVTGHHTLRYNGALGNPYFANSLGDIIAQEMVNPRVHPHLHFYPEDSGIHLSEARQAERWLHEMDNDALTPVAEMNGQRFFVYELAKLTSGEFCMPVRWFTRHVGEDMQLFAKCWWVVDAAHPYSGETRWVVCKDKDWEVPLSQFMFDWHNLCERFNVADAGVTVPADPQMIYGKFAITLSHGLMPIDIYDLPGFRPQPSDSVEQPLQPWSFSNPKEGNRWQPLSQGHRVHTFPIWMYCNDTSGNVSKRWNEHNSFLFTPSGLPPPPLEMLDGIVDQLESLQRNSVWAWDCVYNAPVLVFPVVLALLGDNPMQGEFASHIGLHGHMFCLSCYVSGKVEGSDEHASGPRASEVGEQSTASQEQEASGIDETRTGLHGPSILGFEESPTERELMNALAAVPAQNSRRKRAVESLQGMVMCLKAFVKPGAWRTKEETTAKLRSYFTDAQAINAKTKTRTAQTESGVKDTFQEHFLDKLFSSYAKVKGKDKKQQSLNTAAVHCLPSVVDWSASANPVWRIKGLDPHCDTPVEVLHVVLLGFVKYFWRDAINNQIGKDDVKHELLKTHLNCFDIDGLGLDGKLSGHTLVQYAGSLMGSDFRTIAQVAPFVLYDLISRPCYAT